MADYSVYFKINGGNISLLAEELNVIIPNHFFESGLAELMGQNINSFGILDFVIKDKGKSYKGTFNIATFNTFYPTETVNEKDSKGNKVTIMKFFKGDDVMSKAIIQDFINSVQFMQLICKGKLPNNIPYSKLLDVFNNNLESNGVKYKIASITQEIILREMYRTKEDLTKTYSTVTAKNKNYDEFGYVETNINQNCALASTFSAITFENMDEMIITSVNKHNYSKEEAYSPLEKIIKM